MDYDCTLDVLQHKYVVAWYLSGIANILQVRALLHDNSKLISPEKECFDKWTPELKEHTFGSDYYKQALSEMGEGLKHHYAKNSHHTEHFHNGIDGMNLLDVIEMVCDWKAAANAKGVTVDLEHAIERFNISSQLANIIRNTLNEPWLK